MIHSPIEKLPDRFEVGTVSASLETLKVRDARAAAMQEAACRSVTITKREEDLLAHHSKRNAETTHFTCRQLEIRVRNILAVAFRCPPSNVLSPRRTVQLRTSPAQPPEKKKADAITVVDATVS